MFDGRTENQELVKFFHKNTSLNKVNIVSLQMKIADALDDTNFITNCFKPDCIFQEYNEKTIALEKSVIRAEQDDNLYRCLMKRRTNSKLPKIEEPLDFEKFSKLIYYSFGASEINLVNNNVKFTYPTSGGLNTIEIFIVVNNVSKIDSGIYLYNPYVNTLKLVRENFSVSEYKNITGLFNQGENSFFSVHIVGNCEFSHIKYGDRAYRFMNIEAGHCSQNLYLMSTSLGLECAASGAFLDDEFFEFLKISDKNRYLLYENFVGL